MKRSFDPIQLQRLIDGECSLDDVRSLLISARVEPGVCEDIALALLEERAWQIQLGSISAEGIPPSELALSLNGLEAGVSSAETNAFSVTSGGLNPEFIASQVRSSSASQSAGDDGQRPGTTFHWKNWFAMAASLLAVAALGYSAGQQGSQSEIPGQFAQQPVKNASPKDLLNDQASPMTTLTSHKPDYRMELPDHDRLLPGGEVPLYVVNSLDQWQQLDQPLPQEFRLTPEQIAELNLQGIGIEKDFNVLTGRFDDGRTFVVPIRSIRLSPVQ